MKALKYAIIVASVLITVQAQALLTVRLLNNTHAVCKLESYDLRYGVLWTAAPQRVDPTLEAKFILGDSLSYGPEIELNYECDGKKISLNCQEDHGVFVTGDVHARLDFADPSITARATFYGLYYGSPQGVIEWTIENR